ncbi:MAG: hypothetical protein Q7T55_17335 [Solirubrobacteraceae bacterium]|nr:hypothetical protein [Solirubrobacteraceae bacterium]
MKKILLIAAFGLGYVLGARAGRKRYENIREKAQQFWNDEHVQSAVHGAGELVESAVDKVGDKAGDLIGKARGNR